MAEILLYLAVAFSGLATVLVIFVLANARRQQAVSGIDMEAFAAVVRTEADRTRTDHSDQARGTRQEIGDSIQRLQDSQTQQLKDGIEALRTIVNDIGKKLDNDIERMGQEAQQGREVLRNLIETKLDNFGDRQTNMARDLRADLTTSFKNTTDVISQTMKDLGAQQQERLDKVANELKGMAERQEAAQESLRNTVQDRLDVLRTENSAKLDEMRQTVDEKLQTTLEQRLGDSFKIVSEQLDRVHKGLGEMQTLANGVGDLKRVLSNVKVRGTIAEAQLGALLEQFLSPDQFLRNAQIKKHSDERVEFAIKFAARDADGPTLLPIDAKFPRDDYERLVQASELADADGVEEAAASLERSIKSFAKSISDKYIDPPTTTDYAILFLPTESLFAEVLRRPGLHELLQHQYRVMIAGPTTLASMLSAFQMGFRSLAIQERSTEVWRILGAVRTEFAEHGKVVDRLQKQLGTASKTIEALGTRTRAMNRKLKDVQTLPAAEAPGVLGLTSAALAAEEDSDENDTSA